MTQTVEIILGIAEETAKHINDINSNGISGMSQEDINTWVQRYVTHLENILACDGSNSQPNVVGDSSDKTFYTDAINTGKAYLEAN